MIKFLLRFIQNQKNIVIERITESRDILAAKNIELEKLSIVASKTDNGVLITDKNGNIEVKSKQFEDVFVDELNTIQTRISIIPQEILETTGPFETLIIIVPNVNMYYTGGTFSNTCPLQINPQGINVTAADVMTICASVGIAKPPNSLVSGYAGTQHNVLGLAHTMSNARVYLPSVKLSLDAEQALISKGASKKVKFYDYLNTSTTVSANTNIQMVVSNSVKNATGLLIVPMISKSVNGTIAAIAAAKAVSVLQSPFYPAVPCPLSLTQLNVNVGGQNVFQQQALV
jgi:hypothetical protein